MADTVLSAVLALSPGEGSSLWDQTTTKAANDPKTNPGSPHRRGLLGLVMVGKNKELESC